ncbi:flagellar type III secretion system protein FlhB [Acidovorax sp. NCPPB 2350]|nr:flagellar type III secretion system protein FlhB [Acidovorax sp. NCPPB 2350]
MADAGAGGGDKTEKASPQKLRKAREQGQVARSRDLATAVGVVAGLKIAVLLLPGWLEDFRGLFLHAIAPLDAPDALENLQSVVWLDALRLIMQMVLPLFAVPLCIVAGTLLSGGWVWTGRHFQPQWSKFNPLGYFRRVFAMQHAVDFGSALLKALTLMGVLHYVVSRQLPDFLRLQQRPLDAALLAGADMVLDALLALMAVFVLFALIDVPIQRFVFLRGQRMSKQEIKEEHKSAEGSPEVRQRIRRLQLQMARRSVRKTVPDADVVVVNPEHYAVALRYDAQRAEAPFVVAKGVDEMALYIRAVAREHGVEVVEIPPLARAVYHTSQVYQQIPAPLYKAVAQVLGYVLQLKAFQSGRRPTRPALPPDLAVPDHLT